MAVIGEATTVDIEREENEGTHSLIRYGAVYPEATHLEPTTGQIWPR